MSTLSGIIEIWPSGTAKEIESKSLRITIIKKIVEIFNTYKKQKSNGQLKLPTLHIFYKKQFPANFKEDFLEI